MLTCFAAGPNKLVVHGCAEISDKRVYRKFQIRIFIGSISQDHH